MEEAKTGGRHVLFCHTMREQAGGIIEVDQILGGALPAYYAVIQIISFNWLRFCGELACQL